jgi:glucosamine--fructose-6-phosphate aminotransferase (isomerizing)
MATMRGSAEQTITRTKKALLTMNGGVKGLVSQTPMVNWNRQDAHKVEHEHYLLRDILEQPRAIKKATMQDRESFTELALDILRANMVLITGSGSSQYAALVGKHLFSKIARRSCDVVMDLDFHCLSDSVDKDTVVIAVSQSDDTTDVVEGVKKAREHGARVFCIVNGEDTPLSRISHRVININAGPEMGAVATKSFSNQLAVFYLLAYAMMNQFDTGVRKIRSLSSEIDKAISCNNGNLEKVAMQLGDKGSCYYIARGINFAVASEGALKLRQSAQVHAESIHAGELKHGPLALVEEGTSTVVVCPKDYTFSDTLSNAIEAKSRGAYIIGVSDEPNDIYDCWIQIPTVEEVFYPLIAVIPLQLIAYHLATSKGKDSEKPRIIPVECTDETYLAETTIGSLLSRDQVLTSASKGEWSRMF